MGSNCVARQIVAGLLQFCAMGNQRPGVAPVDVHYADNEVVLLYCNCVCLSVFSSDAIHGPMCWVLPENWLHLLTLCISKYYFALHNPQCICASALRRCGTSVQLAKHSRAALCTSGFEGHLRFWVCLQRYRLAACVFPPFLQPTLPN